MQTLVSLVDEGFLMKQMLSKVEGVLGVYIRASSCDPLKRGVLVMDQSGMILTTLDESVPQGSVEILDFPSMKASSRLITLMDKILWAELVR